MSDHQIVTVTALVRTRSGPGAANYVSEALSAKNDVVYIFSTKVRDCEADEWAEYTQERGLDFDEAPHPQDCACDPCETKRYERLPNETRREYKLRTGRNP